MISRLFARGGQYITSVQTIQIKYQARPVLTPRTKCNPAGYIPCTHLSAGEHCPGVPQGVQANSPQREEITTKNSGTTVPVLTLRTRHLSAGEHCPGVCCSVCTEGISPAHVPHPSRSQCRLLQLPPVAFVKVACGHYADNLSLISKDTQNAILVWIASTISDGCQTGTFKFLSRYCIFPVEVFSHLVILG